MWAWLLVELLQGLPTCNYIPDRTMTLVHSCDEPQNAIKLFNILIIFLNSFRFQDIWIILDNVRRTRKLSRIMSKHVIFTIGYF